MNTQRRRFLKRLLAAALFAVLFYNRNCAEAQAGHPFSGEKLVTNYNMSDMPMPTVFGTSDSDIGLQTDQTENPDSKASIRAGDVEINEENFPDAGFREYLKTDPKMQSLHSDPNLFTADEIDSITELDMTNSSLEAESLAGIEHFKNLTTLQCNGPFLKTIDVSKNTELLSLNCAETLNLTTLNVRNCTNLQTLNCNICQLTDLDLSTNGQLNTLQCQNNQLQALNVANNPMLTKLSCDGNQLTALDVSNCPALNFLSCGDNQLSELNITGNMALRHLSCQYNQLTEIDVQDKTSLASFYTGNNLLKTLDVSNSLNLTFFYCNDNQLEEIDVSKNSSLWAFYCQNNQLKTLDVSQNKSMVYFNCTGNRLKSLVLPASTTSFEDCEQFDTIHVAADQDTYDLKTADSKLDGSKISNLTGAQRSGTGSILTNIQTGTDVTYTYDCGNGNTMHVTLRFLQTNRWTAELKISGWKYGDTPPILPRRHYTGKCSISIAQLLTEMLIPPTYHSKPVYGM